MNPKYPVYIVSKGRWSSRLTSKSFERMHVPYKIVIEEQEFDEYANVVDESKILILPQKYLDDYDTFDDLGNTKSKGPGAARNFCWDDSISNGFKRHWVLDDNINGFCRFNRNKRVTVTSGTIFKASEDFVDRYTNIAQAGFQYRFFVSDCRQRPAYIHNTRIYSVLLIQNDIPYRWRGRYNEDTDLSLRLLKDGWCTIQFNAFLQNKAGTQSVSGGNTEAFYEHEGTIPKSKMLEDMHPDVAKVARIFGRDHHHVIYKKFKDNEFIRKEGIPKYEGVNNYGMVLVQVKSK
jgi:hypothetical protein